MAGKNPTKFSKSKSHREKKSSTETQEAAIFQEKVDQLNAGDCKKKRTAAKRRESDKKDNSSANKPRNIAKKSKEDSRDKRRCAAAGKKKVELNLNLPETESTPNLERLTVSGNSYPQDLFLAPFNFSYFPILPESIDYLLELPAFRETLQTDVVTLF